MRCAISPTCRTTEFQQSQARPQRIEYGQAVNGRQRHIDPQATARWHPQIADRDDTRHLIYQVRGCATDMLNGMRGTL